MTANAPAPAPNDLRWLYWGLGVIIVVLCVIGLITYSGQKNTEEAQQKAQELTLKLEAAGLTAPHEKILVRTLGTDGGAVCANPANALGKANLLDQVTNGASHVGRRPLIGDPRIFKGQALILETYCPEELADFQERVSDFKTDNTIKS